MKGSEGQSRDLSSRGIYVQVPSGSIPPVGAYVEMNVSLPQPWHPTRPSEIHAEGRVVRIEAGSSSSEFVAFAAMNHTVILKDAQGRVVDGENSWNELGFKKPSARVIEMWTGFRMLPLNEALMGLSLSMLASARTLVGAGRLVRQRIVSV